MKRKQPSRKDLLASCNEIGPEDGADPRIFFRKLPEKRVPRKALQLCSQVAQTLNYALAWDLGDELLSLLQVDSVVLAPNTSRLLVTVSLPATAEAVDSEQILDRLQRATGKLRAQVAATVNRRRVPELAFRLEKRPPAAP